LKQLDPRLRGCVTIIKQPFTGLRHSGLDPESSCFCKCYATGCRIGVRHDRMKKSPFCSYDTVSCAGMTKRLLQRLITSSSILILSVLALPRSPHFVTLQAASRFFPSPSVTSRQAPIVPNPGIRRGNAAVIADPAGAAPPLRSSPEFIQSKIQKCRIKYYSIRNCISMGRQWCGDLFF
jgi:hypothetical protein